MTPLTLRQVRESLGAATTDSTASLLIRSICTDTRKIEPDCLFIALKGENHDGHAHVQAAAAAGALAAIVDREVQTTIPVIRVDDTRKAMGRLANHIRRNLKSKVIAVAGSNGKTGTKNLIHSVLQNSLSGTISPKSFNNDVGVPTTIFAADPSHDYLVLELGTNHPGEILNLTKIAQPDLAVITTIGSEHLEFFGDLDGVTRENAQIVAGMSENGLLIYNGDFPQLSAAVAAYPGRKITFGLDAGNDLRATNIRSDLEGIRFQLRCSPAVPASLRSDAIHSDLFIPLLGRHTAVNALAAIAAAKYLGLTDKAIIAGLATATGPEMRLQLQTAGSIRILNDSYNANPDSMRAGLETLRDLPCPGRRTAILGDMFELGASSEVSHLGIGRFASECDLDLLVCIGKQAKWIAQAARDAGMDDSRIRYFQTVDACAKSIQAILAMEDVILLKASNGMKLWNLLTSINAFSVRQSLHRRVTHHQRTITPNATNANTNSASNPVRVLPSQSDRLD